MARPLALLQPLDALRGQWLRLISPVAAPLFADRERRVLWLGLISIGFSFALTLVSPLAMIAVGPILLGVPHLLSDVRYLVVRQGLHRNWPWLLLAGLPVLATNFSAGPEVSVFAIAASAALTKGSAWRRLLVALLWFGLTFFALKYGTAFQWAFLHVHNLVALALWWFWRARPKSHALIPLSALLGSALILTGATDPLVAVFSPAYSLKGTFSFTDLIEQTSPLTEGVWPVRLLMSFAFLQSVHYVIWLRLMPEDARSRPAGRTFRESVRALGREFPWPVLLIFPVAALVFLLWGLRDVSGARIGYLQFAAFHGYLELAVAARLFIGGQPAHVAQ